MATLQLLLILALPFAAALAWFRGGRPERAAVAAILASWSVGLALADLQLGRSALGPALCDGALLVVLGGLAFRQDRWWLLAATATQSLVVAAHLALALQPDLTETENLAALAVFRLLCLLTLSAGVLERWLAGEPPAAPGLAAPRLASQGPDKAPKGRPARA